MMRVLVLTPPGTPEDVAAALDGALRAAGHQRLDLPPPPRPLAIEQRAWFAATMDRLLEADLLLADVGTANASVAWALAWFLARGRLAVLTCPAAARAMLSPIVAGNPSPWQRVVEYADARALGDALAAVLSG
jgi:hypothetical protein